MTNYSMEQKKYLILYDQDNASVKASVVTKLIHSSTPACKGDRFRPSKAVFVLVKSRHN